MKSYKVRRSFAGLKEGSILEPNKAHNGQVIDALLLHCGFIEETGKIAQEVGEKKEFHCVNCGICKPASKDYETECKGKNHSWEESPCHSVGREDKI